MVNLAKKKHFPSQLLGVGLHPPVRSAQGNLCNQQCLPQGLVPPLQTMLILGQIAEHALCRQHARKEFCVQDCNQAMLAQRVMIWKRWQCLFFSSYFFLIGHSLAGGCKLVGLEDELAHLYAQESSNIAMPVLLKIFFQRNCTLGKMWALCEKVREHWTYCRVTFFIKWVTRCMLYALLHEHYDDIALLISGSQNFRLLIIVKLAGL